jgi:hypothetical protein
MQRYCYGLGPTTLELLCPSAALALQLQELWRLLFQLRPLPETTTAALQVSLCATDSSQPPPAEAVELFHYGAIQVWQSAQTFGLRCGATHVQINPAQHCAGGCITTDFWQATLAEQREFFQIIFFLLLRRQGYYILHANALLPPTNRLPSAVQSAKSGLLVVGDCGAGKTTLTLSLLQAGWYCVGDDLVILADEGQTGVVAYGLHQGFSCTQQTATAFPALQPLMTEGADLLRAKKFIQVNTLWPDRFAPCCVPRWLLFPTIADQAASDVTGLGAVEAINLLLSQPRAGILADPPTSAGHLQIYGRLVGQATSGRLWSGEDVLTAPATVSQLLAGRLYALAA